MHFAAWIQKSWCECNTTSLKSSLEMAAAAAEDIMRPPLGGVTVVDPGHQLARRQRMWWSESSKSDGQYVATKF
jgi:hypothetical protein